MVAKASHVAMVTVGMAMQQSALVVPAFVTSETAVPLSHVSVWAPQSVISGSQHSVVLQVSAPMEHAVSALALFFFMKPVHVVASLHFAKSVQHSAAVFPTLPALVGSRYFAVMGSAAQSIVLPPHFVSSTSQHVAIAQLLASIAHFVSATLAFVFHFPLHVASLHVAISLQQSAAVVPTFPAFVGSRYLPAPQVMLLPPHFVASAVQQAPHAAVLAAGEVHFMPVSAVFIFLPGAQLSPMAPARSKTSTAETILPFISSLVCGPKKT
jgi:hypothetical protein